MCSNVGKLVRPSLTGAIIAPFRAFISMLPSLREAVCLLLKTSEMRFEKKWKMTRRKKKLSRGRGVQKRKSRTERKDSPTRVEEHRALRALAARKRS